VSGSSAVSATPSTPSIASNTRSMVKPSS
jgi:hypothetical protein